MAFHMGFGEVTSRNGEGGNSGGCIGSWFGGSCVV